MVSRLLIGDNNLTRFWPAFQFGRPLLKGATLITSTDLDTLDNALSQIEEKDQVILSVLTSILMDEVNVLEVASSSLNICSEVVTRLVGLCPQHQSCQFFLAPPEKCELPRWYNSSYQIIYDSLVKLVPKFPPNLHLLPVYATDFTMFDKDGRHFKPVYGKDLVDTLITNADQLMAELEKEVPERLSAHQNSATAMQGQIDLIRSHQASQDRRIGFALAREAEEADSRSNESKVATIILKRLGKIGGSDHQVKTRIRQILSRISKDVDFSIAEVRVRGAELSTRPPIYEVRLEDPDSAVALRKAFALFKKDRIPPELKGIEVFNSVTLATRVRTSILRSIAIGYKRANPASVVSVQSYDPRPCLRVKVSDSSQSFKRYGFVDAVKELDPTGALGLLDPDFQIAYRIASDKFKGKLSELFLVLSDSYTPPPDDDGFQANRPRGQKHRLEDDRMSVESDSKRPDVTTSAEKNQGNKAKNKPKAKANK